MPTKNHLMATKIIDVNMTQINNNDNNNIIIIRDIAIPAKTFSVPNGTVINKGPVFKSIYSIDYEHMTRF